MNEPVFSPNLKVIKNVNKKDQKIIIIKKDISTKIREDKRLNKEDGYMNNMIKIL